MSKQVDRELLQKYLSGTCAADEIKVIREYLNNEDYKESLALFMQNDWQTFDAVETTKEKNIVFSLHRVAVAAILTGLVFTALLLFTHHKMHEVRNSQWVSFTNKKGKQSLLVLPDSSCIYLGAASSVQYNKNYSITNRDIKLEGEAYFIVDHDHPQPFSVISGSLKTVDIGTEFNIRHIKNDSNIEVTVSKGAVDVLHNSPGKTDPITRLNKYQRLLFNSVTNTAKMDSIMISESIGGWRNGVLSFKEKTLEQVAEELKRYYDIDVHFINNESKEILITTTLQNATVDDAIEIISITAGVEIKRKGNIISVR